MSPRYALVLEGVVLEYRDKEPNVDQSKLAPGKPRMLWVEVENEEFDPVSEVREGPEIVVEQTRVIERYTVRAKNEDEVKTLVQAKYEAISDEFQRRCQLSIPFLVDGVQYLWDADQEAIRNITGLLQVYTEGAKLGMDLPDTREWTPFDADSGVAISINALRGLGISIAIRKDVLFSIKKAKQREVKKLTDPKEIAAYDVTKGWE